MTGDWTLAIEALHSARENTLTVCRDGKLSVSTQRGIKPLLELTESDEDLHGACAADRIVGKAAAMLYVLLGVKAVYAEVLSKTARDIFEENHIEYRYETLTDRIINRMGTGLCPMEEAVKETDEPQAALTAIRNKIAEMRKE